MVWTVSNYPVWMTQKPRKGDFGELTSKTFPGEPYSQTSLEVGNRSVLILDPRLTKTGTFTPWKGKKLTQSTYKSNWHFLCESCKTNLKRWFASSSTSSSEQLGNLFCNSSDICNTTWNLENNKFTQRKSATDLCYVADMCSGHVHLGPCSHKVESNKQRMPEIA